MRFSMYAVLAHETAIYPQEYKYIYPSLGLGGEIGELCGKLDGYDTSAAICMSDIKKEIGDVLWYVANTTIDAGINIQEMFRGDDYQFDGIQCFARPQRSVLILASLGGQACELAKKYLRDDGGVMSEERRNKVHGVLQDILCNLGGICNKLGISLEEAAQGNLDKLKSRKERGVLTGDGDNR